MWDYQYNRFLNKMYKLEGKYGSSRAVSIRLNTLTISPTWDLGLVLLQVYCVAKGDIRVAYTRAKPATIFRRTLYYHVNKRSRESGCNSNSSKNHDLDTYPGFAGAVTETSDEGHQTSNIYVSGGTKVSFRIINRAFG